MIKFFKYNWQIRDEWFKWCEQLTYEELTAERTGGVNSILYTFFHIIDVEYSWIRGIQGKDDVVLDYEDYQSLEKVNKLSNQLREDILYFLQTDLNQLIDRSVRVSWDENTYTADDILHHVIVHEIHHIGQLSVWARDLKLTPVSANFIGR